VSQGRIKKGQMDKEPIASWKWNQHWNRSIAEAIAELEREAHVRLRCFDRWIQDGKVSRVDAWDRMERILTAINLLRIFEMRKMSEELEQELGAEQESIVTDLARASAA
jgi:hypothetical protein